MEIRELQIDDAEKFLNLINITEGETPYLLYEKGERKNSYLIDGEFDDDYIMAKII